MAPYQGKNHRAGGGGGNRTGGSYPPRENVSLRLQHLPTAKDKGDYYLVEVIVELLVSGRLAQGKIVHLSVDSVNWITKTTDTNGSASHVFMISKTNAGKKIEIAAKTEDGKTEVKSSVDVPKRIRPKDLYINIFGEKGRYSLELQAVDESGEGVMAEVSITDKNNLPLMMIKRKETASQIITTNEEGWAKVDLLPFCKADERRTVLLQVVGSTIVKTVNLGEAKKEGDGPNYSLSPLGNFLLGLSGG